MLFVTHYQLVGKRSKKRTVKLMTLFGERGEGPGTLGHYVYADGGGGFVISDESGLARLYEDSVTYAPYMEFETRPLLTIEEAVPTIAAWMTS